jgi:hypothetical protein
MAGMQHREDQVFLVLALVIGALTGLAVAAFIVLTERVGMRLYPPRWYDGKQYDLHQFERSKTSSCDATTIEDGCFHPVELILGATRCCSSSNTLLSWL